MLIARVWFIPPPRRQMRRWLSLVHQKSLIFSGRSSMAVLQNHFVLSYKGRRSRGKMVSCVVVFVFLYSNVASNTEIRYRILVFVGMALVVAARSANIGLMNFHSVHGCRRKRSLPERS
jgi:hypothetical protein